jgi:GNAT superfamily N-acetyltransferase
MRCIAEQAFDTQIFGVPFFRVVALDLPALGKELTSLLRRPPLIIDAKIPANAHDATRILHGFGFHTVCTQIALVHRLFPVPDHPPAVSFARSSDMSEMAIRAHVENFRSDRFSLDFRIDRAARDNLYAAWIRNSIGGRAQLALYGANFCSFREGCDVLTIDLLSVLDKRRGIGRNLVNAVLAVARGRGVRAVQVVTECGNEAAWRLYLSCGFAVTGFLDCLHYVDV